MSLIALVNGSFVNSKKFLLTKITKMVTISACCLQFTNGQYISIELNLFISTRVQHFDEEINIYF